MDGTKERPIYRKFQVNPSTEATPIFGISCDEGWKESIVCTGMYEYAVDWLLPIIQHRPYCPTFDPRPACTCKYLGGGRGNGDVFFPARFEKDEACPRHGHRMQANPKRIGTPHETEHAETLACHAPPKCDRARVTERLKG